MVTDTSTVKVPLRTLIDVPAVWQFKQPRAFYGRGAHSKWVNLQVTAKIGSGKICKQGMSCLPNTKKI